MTLSDKELRKLAELGCDNWSFSVKSLLEVKAKLCQSMQITAGTTDVSGEVNVVDLTSSDEDEPGVESEMEEVAMVENPNSKKRKDPGTGSLSDEPATKQARGDKRNDRHAKGTSPPTAGEPWVVGGVKFNLSVDSGSGVAYVDEVFGQKLRSNPAVKVVPDHRRFKHVGQGIVEVKERLDFEANKGLVGAKLSVYIFPRSGDGDVVVLGRSACKAGGGLLDFRTDRVRLYGDWSDVVFKSESRDADKKNAK